MYYVIFDTGTLAIKWVLKDLDQANQKLKELNNQNIIAGILVGRQPLEEGARVVCVNGSYKIAYEKTT